jgi:hypothetical protein
MVQEILLLLLTEVEQMTWEMANEIIQKQYDLAVISIIVILGISAFFVGANLISSYRLNKRKLDETLELVEKNLKIRIDALFKDKSDQMDEKLQNNLQKNRDELQKSTKNQILNLKGENACIFGETKDYETAVIWWCEAITKFSEANNEDRIGILVLGLKDSLGKCEVLKKNSIESVEHIISILPTILSVWKEELQSVLKKIPEQT